MKKILAIAFLCSLFTTTIYAQEAAPVSSAQIKFTNLDTTYDFGNVPVGFVAQYKFEIKNTGKDDLTITDVHCDLPNIKIQWPNKPVKHGKKGIITITVPTAEIGSFKNDVFVTSNATATPYPFLHISGAIIPAGDPGSPGSSSAPKTGRRGR